MIKDKKAFSILVVEDNPGDVVLIEDYLLEQIIEPRIVNTGSFKEAFSMLSDENSHFDVILLDLTLPDESGQLLIDKMLQVAQECPIIILTGYTDIDFSIKSIAQGILDYLLKDDLNSMTLYKSILYAIERKKTVLELQKSEKRYSDLFYLSPQPTWVYDMDTFKFVQVNNAAIENYGYSKDEFLNMTILDIRPEEEIETTKSIVENFKKTEDKIYKGKAIHLKKSGERIEVEISSNPIIINDKKFRSVMAVDVTEKNQNEHKIIKAIIKTQEDERYEIGGELHDNVCQLLVASKLTLGMLKGGLEPSSFQWFDKSEEYIIMALEEIRNLSHRLAPAFFNDTTLEEAFKKLFDNFNVQDKYEMLLHFDNAVKKYPMSLEIQLNLYRILQEQLKNILKYAKATLIEVDLIIFHNNLKMSIADNGVGFDTTNVKGGIGLANMKRRAELFSGNLIIQSAPGDGCTLLIDIPLRDINKI
jgi:PAS domain S-box-containing protein